jgi:hypothetical protein
MPIFTNILDADNKQVLADLLHRCSSVNPIINSQQIMALANDHCKATNDPKKIPMPVALQVLFDRWYNSLPTGTPDYTVYGHDDYIAELWACWKVYSRQHLRNIQKSKCLPTGSITAAHGDAKTIVDLGCGFAYTTATIKQIFPNATVYGTNLDGTLQMSVAKQMAVDYNFTMCGDPSGVPEVDLAFASEYFEHFDKPLEHLDLVIETIKPKAMLIANAFGPKAIGHFDSYSVEVNPIVGHEIFDANTTGKLFNKRMKQHGYSKVKTKLWNNRPAYWVKNSP